MKTASHTSSPWIGPTVWAFGIGACALSWTQLTIKAQEPREQQQVETVTEAENVPAEADQVPEQTPAQAEPLPPEDGKPLPPDSPDVSRQPQGQAAQSTPPSREMQTAPRELGFNLGQSQRGVTIQGMQPRGAAAAIGLRDGDEIVAIGNHRLGRGDQFGRTLERALSDGPRRHPLRLPMQVRRGGRVTTVYWTSAALAMAGYGPLLTQYGYEVPPQYVTGYRGATVAPPVPSRPDGAYLGVELNPQFPEAAIVSKVAPGSPAEQAGLKEGDRIWAIDNDRIETTGDLILLVSRLEPGAEVEIHFSRPQSVRVALGRRDHAQPAEAPRTAAPSSENHESETPEPGSP